MCLFLTKLDSGNHPKTQEYYVNHTAGELVSHNMERLKAFSSAIEGVIKSHIVKEDPVVIEGFGLWPEYIKNLNLPDIGMVWLVADETLLDKRTRRIKSFYKGASDEEKMIQNHVGRSVWYNSKVIEAVDKLDIPTVQVSDKLSAEALSIELLNILKLNG